MFRRFVNSDAAVFSLTGILLLLWGAFLVGPMMRSADKDDAGFRPSDVGSRSNPKPVAADKLLSAFTGEETKALNNFGTGYLRLTEKVEKVETPGSDYTTVTLVDPDTAKRDERVVVEFVGTQAHRAAQLKPGDKVEFTAKYYHRNNKDVVLSQAEMAE